MVFTLHIISMFWTTTAKEYLYLCKAPARAHLWAQTQLYHTDRTRLCLSSVLIKTLKLLAPSSTNPIALCSLILQPNSLTQRLSHSSPPALPHSLSPYVSVSICDFLWWMEEAKEERGECETLHHWGQWGEGKKQIGRMREAETKRGGVKEERLGCRCTWIAYKSAYMHSAPAFMSCMQSVCALTLVCVYDSLCSQACVYLHACTRPR